MDENIGRLQEQLLTEIDSLAPELFRIAHHIFDHPEVKFEEFEAMRTLSGALEEAGFRVERGVAGLPTAFVARAEGQLGGSSIGLLGEYDALPELGHACGHHQIGAIALGAALALKKLLPQLEGRVIYIGTPAEEMAGGGKIIMAEAGVFDDLDAAMLVHPADHTVVEAYSLCGGKVVLTFRGKTAHAAAAPHLGINALDALLLTYNNINALRQHLRPDVRIHGIITKGGDVYSAVPERTEAVFSVRAADYVYREETLKKVIACAEAGALASGATLSTEVSPTVREMRTNFALAHAFARHCQELGYETEEADRDAIGGTDMGNVSHIVPTIHPHFAVVPGGIPAHTREFAAATVSEAGLNHMIAATKVMALTALDFLARPQLREEVSREFVSRSGEGKS
jgi:amidohydrolase